jgi:hypothetical protein
LTRSEALELITPIVDGEATEDEELAFYAYAQKDPTVLLELQREHKLKSLIVSKCKRAAAPPSLHKWVAQNKYEQARNSKYQHFINDPIDGRKKGEIDFEQILNEKRELPEIQIHPNPIIRLQQRTWAITTIAAAILLMIIYTVTLSWDRAAPSPNTNIRAASINVSQQTYNHFIQSAGQLYIPTYSTTNQSEAINWVRKQLELGISVPEIQSATFKGVYLADFDTNFKTPLLEYEGQAGESIFVFVFSEDRLTQSGRLTRTPKAVESCSTSTTYYIEDIQGKHVVSWRWGNNWYSAISNYNGDQLATMVEPLSH